MTNLSEYTGVIHVHTTASDGSGGIKDVVRAARDSKVDFVLITDHDTLEHKDRGNEGWHDNVLVLVGEEISPKKNHYLAFGIDKEIYANGKCPDDYIREVERQGGIGFIVHPYSKRKISIPLFPARPWTDWRSNRWTGIELWSYMFDWVEPVSLANIIYYYFNPEKAITGPSHAMIRLWDKFTAERQVVAIGGIDAHARNVMPFGILQLFSYKRLFKTVRTHVLTQRFTGELNKDKEGIYDALRRGHCYIAYDLLGDSAGFRFEAKCNGAEFIMGDKLELTGETELSIILPKDATLRIIRDGGIIREGTGNSLKMVIKKKGVYRGEAYLDNKPWVFTNPIYVEEGTI